jgi:hypothetical protein
MSFIANFTDARRRNKLLLDVSKSAVAFFLALAVNSCVEHRKSNAAFRSTMKAVALEAELNDRVLNESFRKFSQLGIVFRPFALTTSTQILSNPPFAEHTFQELKEALARYISRLTLANGYPQGAETPLLSKPSDDKASALWLDALQAAWQTNLDECEENIAEVRKLTKEQ